MKQAIVIAAPEQTDTVGLGHKVTIETDNGRKTYLILGSSETNPQKGIISNQSPIGMALLGHKIGEVVKVKLADKEVIYKIIKVE